MPNPATVPIWQVDAFTDRPFAGNPAAVCVLPDEPSDAWMQAVAAEMNLSETAFLVGGDDRWSLRWFTPGVEVDLCGHATLASAHILWTTGRTDAGTLAFETRSGLLTARRDGPDIVLDFPATPPEQAPAPDRLAEALGLGGFLWTGRTRFDLFVVVDAEATVRELAPRLGALIDVHARGVIVTAVADAGSPADFVSRFFAPAVGVDEDPVTGSAHCALAPYWRERLGRDTLVGAQLSRRGGLVRTTVRGDRVELAGQAVTVLEGALTPSVHAVYAEG